MSTEPLTTAVPAEIPVEVAEANLRKNVRVFLAVRGRSSSDLARHLHVSTGRMSERMAGKTRFTIAELLKISRYLDVPVELLFEDPEEALSRNRCFSQVLDQGQMHLLDLTDGHWVGYNDRPQLEAVGS